jgi:dihydrofolate reductase
MRKIIVLSLIALDSVMQGCWTVPYFDEFLGTVMTEQMSQPFDLLLGRKTFEIFASYWPQHEEEGAGQNSSKDH